MNRTMARIITEQWREGAKSLTSKSARVLANHRLGRRKGRVPRRRRPRRSQGPPLQTPRCSRRMVSRLKLCLRRARLEQPFAEYGAVASQVGRARRIDYCLADWQAEEPAAPPNLKSTLTSNAARSCQSPWIASEDPPGPLRASDGRPHNPGRCTCGTSSSRRFTASVFDLW